MVRYVDMSIEDAVSRLNKRRYVLAAKQDLTRMDEDLDVKFQKIRRPDYHVLLEGVETVISIYDDFINQMLLFTEKQNFPNIEPRGTRTIILF